MLYKKNTGEVQYFLTTIDFNFKKEVYGMPISMSFSFHFFPSKHSPMAGLRRLWNNETKLPFNKKKVKMKAKEKQKKKIVEISCTMKNYQPIGEPPTLSHARGRPSPNSRDVLSIREEKVA